jgi:putative ABC transport system substrate-binding protein
MRSFGLYFSKIFFGGLCLLMCTGALSSGAAAEDGKAVALVSLKIKPYMQALEAMEEVLLAEARLELEPFFLDDDELQDRDRLTERLSERSNIAVFIAVGPEAAHYLWTHLDSHGAEKVYTMVLNPGKILPEGTAAQGISLNIPTEIQVEIIREAFPEFGNVGLICNPEHNAEVLQDAIFSGARRGVTIVPLEAEDRKEIQHLLRENLRTLDGLWMIPDRTVISESLVAYIIKAALKKGVPVIGFNRFFYEKGAALCFLFDYGDIGRQTGWLAIDVLRGGGRSGHTPVFSVWYNVKVLTALGIEVTPATVNGNRMEPGP